MGLQSFTRNNLPTTGIATLDGDYQQVLEAVDQLLDLNEHDTRYAAPILAKLTRLAEEHAGMIERLLQRANSDALIAARRGHEALLLYLEELQEEKLQPMEFLSHLHRVCGFLLAILVQDAAAVRRCGGKVCSVVH